MDTPVFRKRLLAWYDRSKRDLPWRKNQDPYRVWVSEIMLQQTQVATVLNYYEPFLKKFPSVQALARASEQDVLAAWAGLGYYRRARHLHAAAQEVAAKHGGLFPKDPEAKLPGIGRYTLGAILSIAYGTRLPVLDGNVARVLSRLFAVEGEPKKNEKKLWGLAEELLAPKRPGDWNQAMMELGATVCTPSSPSCLLCPIASLCEARQRGLQDRLPLPAARKDEVPVEWEALLALKDGKVLLENRAQGLLKDHWGLPEARPGLEAGKVLGRVRHQITHHRVRLTVKEGRWTGGRLAAGLRWTPKKELPRYLVSSLWKKALILPKTAELLGR